MPRLRGEFGQRPRYADDLHSASCDVAGFDADALKRGWFDFRRKRFWAWVLLALYTVFGFVVAPLIVRSVIVSEIHSLLGLDATLDDVDINPFALTVRLEKFAHRRCEEGAARCVRRTGCKRAAVEHRESRVDAE